MPNSEQTLDAIRKTFDLSTEEDIAEAAIGVLYTICKTHAKQGVHKLRILRDGEGEYHVMTVSAYENFMAGIREQMASESQN